MLKWLKTQAEERLKARKLYGAVVAQARLPEHFTLHGAADTPEGRYEMIVLHLALLSDRLLAEGPAGHRLATAVNSVFVADMDDAMREMGVGDLTVPKKVKKAAAGLYDRFEAYRAARAAAEPGELERRLAEMLAGSGGATAASARLAAYVEAQGKALAAVPAATLLAGEFAFAPVPAAHQAGDRR